MAAVPNKAVKVNNSLTHLKSSLCNSFKDQAPVDFIYGCLIFKWLAETSQEGSSIVASAMIYPIILKKQKIFTFYIISDFLNVVRVRVV